jgi:hypothetical protein
MGLAECIQVLPKRSLSHEIDGKDSKRATISACIANMETNFCFVERWKVGTPPIEITSPE